MSPGLDGHLAGVTVAWEIDIFGGRRSDAQAAAAVALSAEERLRGTRLAIAADVAENYVAARGLQRRLQLLDRSMETIGELLRYTRARYAAGQALPYDIDRVSEQLGALQAQRPVLANLISIRERRLAVLAGQVPQSATALSPPPPFFVPAPPAGAAAVPGHRAAPGCPGLGRAGARAGRQARQRESGVVPALPT
ncbi:TolC family protein [Cupriavidus basilensis]